MLTSGHDLVCSHVAPQDAVMIGDDVRQDVGGANAIGMQSILVRTGKYRAGDEGAAGPCA